MSTYFVVLMNKAGAVCASNSSNTIFELSDCIPVAFAFEPSSEFPWRECLSHMKQEHEPVHYQVIDDYIYDLEEIINGRMSIDDWKDWLVSSEEAGRTVFVVGFGQDDIFPSCIKAMLTYEDDAFSLSWEDNEKSIISHENRADICWLGNFDCIEPVIYGIQDKGASDFERFVSLENEKILRNMNVNSGVTDFLMEEIDAELCDSAAVADERQFETLKTGIETFSIENMVSSAEMMINANTVLSDLSMEDKDYLKEIIVIQIPEGVTWCLKEK